MRKLLADEKKKKIVIAVLFGLVSFALNLFPITIYETEGVKITILLGVVFPLFISIVWGWKYGLLSALIGGYQSLWFLWYGDGYGVLYSVPIYILWVVCHGVLSDITRRLPSKKWFHSAFLTELIFRTFSELGFITVFTWLVAKKSTFLGCIYNSNERAKTMVGYCYCKAYSDCICFIDHNTYRY